MPSKWSQLLMNSLVRDTNGGEISLRIPTQRRESSEREQNCQSPSYGVSGQLFILFGHPCHGGSHWNQQTTVHLQLLYLYIYIRQQGFHWQCARSSNKFRVDWAIPDTYVEFLQKTMQGSCAVWNLKFNLKGWQRLFSYHHENMLTYMFNEL